MIFPRTIYGDREHETTENIGLRRERVHLNAFSTFSSFSSLKT